MRNEFPMKKGDTAPSIQYKLPTDVDVSGATVVFNMRKVGASSSKINRGTATFSSVEPPIAQYDWADSDTDTSGNFYAEFEVNYANSSRETFPQVGYIEVTIIDDLG